MNVLEEVEVEYRTFAGWKQSIDNCRTFDSLPKNAQLYLKFIEEYLETPGKAFILKYRLL